MNGCIYRTKDGECDLYAEGGKYEAFCDMDGCKGRKMSNADRIRTMTDEELAKLLTDAQCPSDLGGTDKCENPPPHTSLDSILCRECWLEWLGQEAT